MSPSDATLSFLAEQIAALKPFDFLIVADPSSAFDGFEVGCEEDGSLRVRLAPRPPGFPVPASVTDALGSAGFVERNPGWHSASPWELEHQPRSADEAADAVERALDVVFGLHPGARVDINHGSRRGEHEAERKLLALREHIRPLLAELLGAEPTTDADGDFVFRYDSVQVFVAPRAEHGRVIVRVFAITNVGVDVVPELGLFLSRLNFGLLFGRFSLDVEHQAVWFDQALLGDAMSDEELKFVIKAVAATANEWDDRVKEMFGGETTADVLAKVEQTPPKAKPGQLGYL